MKTFWVRVPCVLGCIFLSTIFSIARAADTNPPPRLTVELRDGSRVVGDSVARNFEFQSALLGKIKLAVKDIRSVECVSSNSAKLSVINGDSLVVSFVDSSFAVKTSFGKVDLQINLVRKISVAAGGGGAHPPGLVALWSGEGEGIDSIGGNTATLTDITFAEGKVGQAFSFNGISSTIRIPASPALDVGAGDGFTIMAWIKPSDVNGIHPLIQWVDESPVLLSIGLRPYDDGLLQGCLTDYAGNRLVLSHPEVLVSGIFQHIALTFDKASDVGTMYLNGVIVARRQLSGQVAGTKGDLWISLRHIRQGDWSSNCSFAGLMDEIAIYNRALSAEEIQSICTEENHGEPLARPTSSTGLDDSMR